MVSDIDKLVRRDELELKRRASLKRRRIILIITLGIVCLLLTFFILYQFTDVIFGLTQTIQSTPQAGEWAMFRRDAGHSGVIDEGAPASGALKWTFATGAPIDSSPAVVNGIVYIGSRDHNLYALDAATGEVRWKFATG